MMEIQITCPTCKSSVDIYPDHSASKALCEVCSTEIAIKCNVDHENSILKDCPVCERKDFYSQKDFNRKIGASLFILTILISTALLIWSNPMYAGLPFIVLYLIDLALFGKLARVCICYKCNTNFRKVANISDIRDYDHEMNDRIVYADHNFEGKPLSH